MEIPRLSKIQRIALGSIVVIQMVHTLYWLIHHLYYTLKFPPETLDGIRQPFVEAAEWKWIAAWLAALLVGIVLLRSLAKARAWAWISTLIILITSGVYVAWVSCLVLRMWDIPAREAILLLPLSYGFFALWASRRAFSIRMADLIQVAVAAILASMVIFIDAICFPDGVTDWVEPVPH
jgi:hypothetical protein